MSIEWCSKSDGVTYQFAKNLEVISEALYQAARCADSIINFLGKTVDLFFNSGVVWRLFDGNGVPDFRFHAVKFWCMGIKFEGFPAFQVILPKQDLTDMFNMLIAKLDVEINNSRNWLYKDTDGVIKQGKYCLVPHGYMLLGDGLNDIKPLMIFLVIIKILKTSGLDKLVSNFILKYYGMRLNRAIKSGLISVLQGQKDLDSVVDQVLAEVDLNTSKIGEVSDRLGVRLLLR